MSPKLLNSSKSRWVANVASSELPSGDCPFSILEVVDEESEDSIFVLESKGRHESDPQKVDPTRVDATLVIKQEYGDGDSEPHTVAILDPQSPSVPLGALSVLATAAHEETGIVPKELEVRLDHSIDMPDIDVVRVIERALAA